MVNPQTPLDESLDSYAQTGLREQKRDWLQVGRRKINSERKARNGGTALPSSSKWRSGQRKIQRALASRSYLERTSVVLPRGPTALRVGLSAAELPTYFCRTPPVIHGSYVLTIGPEKKKERGWRSSMYPVSSHLPPHYGLCCWQRLRSDSDPTFFFGKSSQCSPGRLNLTANDDTSGI